MAYCHQKKITLADLRANISDHAAPKKPYAEMNSNERLQKKAYFCMTSLIYFATFVLKKEESDGAEYSADTKANMMKVSAMENHYDTLGEKVVRGIFDILTKSIVYKPWYFAQHMAGEDFTTYPMIHCWVPVECESVAMKKASVGILPNQPGDKNVATYAKAAFATEEIEHFTGVFTYDNPETKVAVAGWFVGFE
jgi:hypothetical protein